jgi:hypothetical protein
MRQQICDASSPLYSKQVEGSKEATRSSGLEMRSDILVVEVIVVFLYCMYFVLGQPSGRAIREFGVGFLGRTRWFVGRRLGPRQMAEQG